jgi:hypothetical protein
MDNDITTGTRVLVRSGAADPAYATVTGIDHHRDHDVYHLSVAGIDKYLCTPDQLVRVLTEEQFRRRYGGADPDRHYLQRHPVATRPAPYLELTGYLIALAAEHGYAVEVDELDPTLGFHPREVIAWAAAGARHATIGYLRALLADPIEFLRSQDPDSGLLERLLAQDRHLADLRAAAARRYATCCHLLLPTGLIWTAPNATGTRPGGRFRAGIRHLRRLVRQLGRRRHADACRASDRPHPSA